MPKDKIERPLAGRAVGALSSVLRREFVEFHSGSCASCRSRLIASRARDGAALPLRSYRPPAGPLHLSRRARILPDLALLILAQPSRSKPRKGCLDHPGMELPSDPLLVGRVLLGSDAEGSEDSFDA